MKALQREAYVCKRAYELANSGAHIDCITIVSALAEEGFPEAAEILSSEIIRADLRSICASHWKGADAEAARREPFILRLAWPIMRQIAGEDGIKA